MSKRILHKLTFRKQAAYIKRKKALSYETHCCAFCFFQSYNGVIKI